MYVSYQTQKIQKLRAQLLIRRSPKMPTRSSAKTPTTFKFGCHNPSSVLRPFNTKEYPRRRMQKRNKQRQKTVLAVALRLKFLLFFGFLRNVQLLDERFSTNNDDGKGKRIFLENLTNSKFQPWAGCFENCVQLFPPLVSQRLREKDRPRSVTTSRSAGKPP